MSVQKSVLVLEDDMPSALYLAKSLRENGFKVDLTHRCDQFRKEVDNTIYDAYILDVNLPDGDGISLCKELKESGIEAPVLILTGSRTDEKSAIKALSIGAEDYLRKPFGGQELVVKLNKLLKTYPSVKIGELTLHYDQRSATWGDKSIEVSRREFDILWVLGTNKGKVLSRAKLLESLAHESEMLDRSLDSHISRIRKKLKKTGVELVGVYGVGYQLVEQTEQKKAS